MRKSPPDWTKRNVWSLALDYLTWVLLVIAIVSGADFLWRAGCLGH